MQLAFSLEIWNESVNFTLILIAIVLLLGLFIFGFLAYVTIKEQMGKED